MAVKAVGTGFIDYTDHRSEWGEGPYAGDAIAIWVPRGILDLLTNPSSAIGTTTPGGQGFGHQSRVWIRTDGPGTSGGTQSIMILGSSSSSSSSSSSCSSSSSSSLSSSSSSLSSSSSSSLSP